MPYNTPVAPTVGEIARRLDVALHRVEYAIRAYEIHPVGWAGNARVFSEEAVQRIAEIVGAVSPLKANEGRRGAGHD